MKYSREIDIKTHRPTSASMCLTWWKTPPSISIDHHHCTEHQSEEGPPTESNEAFLAVSSRLNPERGERNDP